MRIRLLIGLVVLATTRGMCWAENTPEKVPQLLDTAKIAVHYHWHVIDGTTFQWISDRHLLQNRATRLFHTTLVAFFQNFPLCYKRLRRCIASAQQFFRSLQRLVQRQQFWLTTPSRSRQRTRLQSAKADLGLFQARF